MTGTDTAERRPFGGERAREWALYACVLVVPWALFYPALDFDFDADDAIMIVENAYMRDPGNWWRMLSTDAFDRTIKGFAYEEMSSLVGHWRPLNKLSYLIDYSLWGPRSGPFHLTNIAIHLASGCLLAWMLRLLGLPRWAAGASALVFLIHPVAARQVGRVSLRADLICGFWCMATVVLAHKGRQEARTRYLWGSYASAFLSLAGKETALFLPLLFSAWAYARHRRLVTTAAESWPYWAAIVAYALLRFGVFGIALAESPDYRPMGGWTLFLSLSRLAFSYVSELPLPTLVDRVWLPRILEGAPDWTVLLSWAGLAAVGWGLWRLWQSEDRRPLLAALLVLTPVVPLLNIWAIRGEAVGELLPFEPHRLYIPAMGFAMLPGLALVRLGASRPVWRWGGRVALLALISANLILFAGELRAYRDTESLARHNARFFDHIADEELPVALRVQRLQLRAVDLRTEKRYKEAEATLKQVLEIRPHSDIALKNLASLALSQRQPDLAIEYIQTVLNPMPYRGPDGVVRELIRDSQLRHTGVMHKMLGQAYQMKEDYEAGRRHFMLSLEIDPTDVDVLLWMAWNGVSLGDSAEAASYLRRFLQQAPSEDSRRQFAARKLRALGAEEDR